LRPVLIRLGYDENVQTIIWFDYTDPSALGEQTQEFRALLPILDNGDIVRITINANPAAVYTANSRNLGRRESADEIHEERLLRLRNRLAEFHPPNASSEDMTHARFPVVIARAFSLAARSALSSLSPNEFVPLSIVRYADGQQMLSVTGMILKRGTRSNFF